MTREELIEWRKKHGFSQDRLAKALGVATNTVARWEFKQKKRTPGEKHNWRNIPAFLPLALKTLERENGK